MNTAATEKSQSVLTKLYRALLGDSESRQADKERILQLESYIISAAAQIDNTNSENVEDMQISLNFVR